MGRNSARFWSFLESRFICDVPVIFALSLSSLSAFPARSFACGLFSVGFVRESSGSTISRQCFAGSPRSARRKSASHGRNQALQLDFSGASRLFQTAPPARVAFAADVDAQRCGQGSFGNPASCCYTSASPRDPSDSRSSSQTSPGHLAASANSAQSGYWCPDGKPPYIGSNHGPGSQFEGEKRASQYRRTGPVAQHFAASRRDA
jgi:hypothetical protein